MVELESDPLPPLNPLSSSEENPPLNEDGTPRRRRGRPPGSVNKLKLDDLTEKLSEQIISLTVPLGIVSPLAYDYLCEQAEDTSRALVRIAAKNPKARKALERFSVGSDYAEVIKLPVGVAVGCLIDLQKIKAQALIGKPFKMESRIEKLYGEDGSENPPPEQNGFHQTGLRGMGANLG